MPPDNDASKEQQTPPVSPQQFPRNQPQPGDPALAELDFGPEPLPEPLAETALHVESTGVGVYAVKKAREEQAHHICEPEAYRKYVAYWGVSGEPPWCCYFLSWCVDTCEVGRHDKHLPWHDVGSTSSVHQWALAHGKMVSTPAHGDIYGEVGDGHIGFVAGAGPNQIYTVNGNWGNCVSGALWTREGKKWRCGSLLWELWFARW